jgi:3-hydroxyisobutyrate dehydrogenase-like beta-hydroxyacid dehydrogenase
VIAGTDHDVAFALAAAAKDLGVILATAEAFGLPAPVSTKTFECYRRAVAAGHGENDIARMVPFALADQAT